MGEQHNRAEARRNRLSASRAHERRVVASLDGADVLAPGPEFVHCRPSEIKYYVANIPYSSVESALRDFFSARVTVVEFHLFRDNATGASRGFAVLRAVGDAVAFDGAEFESRALRIERWDRE
jgi:RNA recognition motif. (a.k.a. RRM, RBD, or RNP domain)